MRRRLTVLMMAAMLAVMVPAQAREPLLIPGKAPSSRLYQRVISHPQATIRSAPGAGAAVVEANLPSFTPLYVYQRSTSSGRQWLEVGSSTDGAVRGWISGDQISEWRQSLTLKFTERTGRQPVLFFKDQARLEANASRGDAPQVYQALARQATELKASGAQPPADFPLIAAEPTDEAVAHDRFYLLPIFQTAQPFVGVKLLEVASIDPGAYKPPAPPAEPDLKTGIVFVIDTTISMRPYIDRSREVVRKVFDQVEAAGLADKVAFGFVAFRNDTRRSPNLGYTVRKIADLTDGRRRAVLEAALGGLEEARASSHSFDEDAFAGLDMAIGEMDWTPYRSRLILLITDAGAIRNDDLASSTGMNEEQIRLAAAAKNIAIFPLHLRTAAGARANDHGRAERQYRQLGRRSDGDSTYIAIEGGDVRAFGATADSIAGEMVRLIEATARGDRLGQPERPAGQSPEDEARWKAAMLGHAMQLDFFGHRASTLAPTVRTGWVADMDINNASTPTFEVCVLMTKDQLSHLSQSLEAILVAAQETKRMGTRDFFQRIMTAAAQMARDPGQFSQRPGRTLQELGVLSDFLDDLPYRSGIMQLTEEQWNSMSLGEQQAFINGLRSKLRLYAEFHDQTDNWQSFGATRAGDALFRMPLTALP